MADIILTKYCTTCFTVRAVWDKVHSQLWFSVLDIVGAINEQNNHEKNRKMSQIN